MCVGGGGRGGEWGGGHTFICGLYYAIIVTEKGLSSLTSRTACDLFIAFVRDYSYN